MKLSIIIPTYNEAPTISLLLDKVCNVLLINDIKKEIIIIDDGSDDATNLIIQNYIKQTPQADIKLFSHPINKGKGTAVKKGIEMATGDFIIIQNADLEYNPEEYNLLLAPIINNNADVVYGSRFSKGNFKKRFHFWNRIGNKFFTFLSNSLSGIHLTDIDTCYKLFRSEILKKIYLIEARFSFDHEVTAKIAKIKGIRIIEVAISYDARSYKEGKKIKAKDGFRAIYSIFKYNLFDMKYLK